VLLWSYPAKASLGGFVSDCPSYGANCGAPPVNATQALRLLAWGSECNHIVDVNCFAILRPGLRKVFFVQHAWSRAASISKKQFPERRVWQSSHLSCERIGANRCGFPS